MYKQTNYLLTNTFNQLNNLITKCNGYEPFYDYDPLQDTYEGHSKVSGNCSAKGFHYTIAYTNDSSEMIGFLSSITNGNTAEITGMVHPKYQKKGIFKEMLSLEKAYLSNKGINIFLGSLPDQLLNTTINKGCHHLEYLLTYTYDKNSEPALSDTTPNDTDVEFFFSDDNTDYMMYKCDSDEADEPVAVLSLDFQASFTNVYQVFVDEALRGRGIGTMLIKHLILDYCHLFREYNNEDVAINSEKIIPPLILQVSSENSAALRVYKKCGFKEISHINYYNL